MKSRSVLADPDAAEDDEEVYKTLDTGEEAVEDDDISSLEGEEGEEPDAEDAEENAEDDFALGEEQED